MSDIQEHDPTLLILGLVCRGLPWPGFIIITSIYQALLLVELLLCVLNDELDKAVKLHGWRRGREVILLLI